MQRLLNFISLFYDTVQAPIAPQNVETQPVPAEPGAFDTDGVFGKYTGDAVRSFQTEFSLPVTGVVSEADWEAMVAVFWACNAQDLYGESDDTAGNYPGWVMMKGSFGPYVLQVQQTLNELGQNYCGVGFVKENGIFDDDTKAAVEAWQKKALLLVSGGVTSATWKSMNDALAVTAIGTCDCKMRKKTAEPAKKETEPAGAAASAPAPTV